jgi:exopolysaccharide biosynthesis predicted pyruvyltransferase EpsI
MSRVSNFRQQGRVQQGKVSPKPNCAHCKNIGLPSDHWLRESADPRSRTVCQVLLKTECLFCHKNGHTISFCEEKKKLESTQAKIAKYNEKHANYQKAISSNNNKKEVIITYGGKFGDLYDDDDDDDDNYKVIDEVSDKKSETPKTTWSSIVQAKIVCEESDEVFTPNMTLLHEWAEQKRMEIAVEIQKPKSMHSFWGKSWADVSDSDDE